MAPPQTSGAELKRPVYVIFGRPDPQDVNLANVGTAGFAINGPTDSLSITLPALTSRGAVFGERLQSVSPEQMSKDVNDDGFDDIVIGDSAVSSGLNTGVGAAYVIYGNRQHHIRRDRPDCRRGSRSVERSRAR